MTLPHRLLDVLLVDEDGGAARRRSKMLPARCVVSSAHCAVITGAIESIGVCLEPRSAIHPGPHPHPRVLGADSGRRQRATATHPETTKTAFPSCAVCHDAVWWPRDRVRVKEHVETSASGDRAAWQRGVATNRQGARTAGLIVVTRKRGRRTAAGARHARTSGPRCARDSAKRKRTVHGGFRDREDHPGRW